MCSWLPIYYRWGWEDNEGFDNGKLEICHTSYYVYNIMHNTTHIADSISDCHHQLYGTTYMHIVPLVETVLHQPYIVPFTGHYI